MTRNISIIQPNFFLLAAFFIFPPTFSFASVDEEGANLFRRSVTNILSNSCLRKNNYGIKIYSLDRGETLYEIRSKKLFIPASNSKVITTAVALKYLGPNYRFSTQIYTDGILESQVLNCLLYTSPSPRDKRQSRMPSSA